MALLAPFDQLAVLRRYLVYVVLYFSIIFEIIPFDCIIIISIIYHEQFFFARRRSGTMLEGMDPCNKDVPTWIICDTDAGVDDAVALCMLLASSPSLSTAARTKLIVFGISC